jgi:hypothetical protein
MWKARIECLATNPALLQGLGGAFLLLMSEGRQYFETNLPGTLVFGTGIRSFRSMAYSCVGFLSNNTSTAQREMLQEWTAHHPYRPITIE